MFSPLYATDDDRGEMEIPEGQLGAAKGKRDLFCPSAVAARECTVGRGFYPLEEGKRSGNPFVACCSFGRNGEGREKISFGRLSAATGSQWAVALPTQIS